MTGTRQPICLSAAVGEARYYDIPHHKNLDLRPARQISHRLDRPRMDQQIARWSVIALARRSPNRWWIGRDVRTEPE